ncbi:MAG: hypothetical protein WBG67_18410 [Thermoanaerobaculia bacterium]
MSRRKGLSTLKLVRIGEPLSWLELESMASRIREAFRDVVSRFQLLEYQPPKVEQIEAGLLTQALEEDFGGHILGITDADLLDRSVPDFFNFVFGCKDNRNHVAVVSTHRIQSRDPSRSLARLLKVSLHELGHNFGLVHHYSYEPAVDGRYCPMTKGDFNRHGERSYVRSVIDARGFHFCDNCRRFLRLTN